MSIHNGNNAVNEKQIWQIFQKYQKWKYIAYSKQSNCQMKKDEYYIEILTLFKCKIDAIVFNATTRINNKIIYKLHEINPKYIQNNIVNHNKINDYIEIMSPYQPNITRTYKPIKT